MKFLLTLLLLGFSAGASFGAPPAPAAQVVPPAAAPASDTTVIPAAGSGQYTPVRSMPSGEDSISMWRLLQSGGWAMIPLGVLSVLTVMFVLVFLFTLRRSSILTAHYMNTADVLLKKRDYLGLLAISSRHSETVARVVQRTLDFATRNPSAKFDIIQDIAQAEGSAQAASLQHRVTYLADIGVLSPMVGLLGTVIGIIQAFFKLGSGDASLARDVMLASGVSQALVATASGLILGIIAMGFYALFRNRVHSLISDMEIATSHLMALLALAFAKKREPTSRVAVEEEF